MPYRDIARRVGLSKSAVHKIVKRQLELDAERDVEQCRRLLEAKREYGVSTPAWPSGT